MVRDHSHFDDIPYPGTVVQNTSPPHLALCSLWHGGPRPPIENYRLIELGCGEGANLLPLAFYNPDSTFIGIDNSKAELQRAQKGAQVLGLNNIQFIHKDVRDLSAESFSRSDYIIVHGVYSWVPDDAREAILRFCAHNLATFGLAYISYNTQPGWANRRLVRETLLRARPVREAALTQKAQKAIEVAALLLQDLPSSQYASAVLLAEELQRVRDGKPGYVFHEYITEVNDGFWFADFAQRASNHGLAYVADAQFGRWEGYVPEEIKKSLGHRQLDRLEREEKIDLFGGRYFRASILCQNGAVRTAPHPHQVMDECYFACSLTANSDPFDLTEGKAEKFTGANQAEVTLEASITKAAIVLLSSQWPQREQFEALHGKATELLVQHGCKVPHHSRALLKDDLATLFEAGQIDLNLLESSSIVPKLQNPTAHQLARYEATHRNTLTTPHHMQLPLDSTVMEFVGILDGSKPLDLLQKHLGEDFVDQTIRTLRRWGLMEG